MLLRDCAAVIRRDSEMGKIRLKSDLELPVEKLNLFLTHVLPYSVVMPGYKQKQYTESVNFITATKRKLVSGIFGWVKKY